MLISDLRCLCGLPVVSVCLDTRAMPERMKTGEADMMEIDTKEDSGIRSPPRTPQRQHGKKQDKKSTPESRKLGESSEMEIECLHQVLQADGKGRIEKREGHQKNYQ